MKIDADIMQVAGSCLREFRGTEDLTSIVAAAIQAERDKHHAWRTDIENAPRGRMETRTRSYQVKGKTVESHTETFVPDFIVAAAKCGTVNKSYWSPPQHSAEGKLIHPGRWSGFNIGSEPVAWMPWPVYSIADEILKLATVEA